MHANPADVESIEAIIAAAYDSISGPAGKKRDWDRMRSLFIAGARLIPTAKDAGKHDVDLAAGTSPSEWRTCVADIGYRRLHRTSRAGFRENRILRKGSRAANRTVRPNRTCLEHVRVASRSERGRAVHARDQQHSTFQRREPLVDLVDLLAARKSAARDSGKVLSRLRLARVQMLLLHLHRRSRMGIAVAFRAKS